MTQYDKAKKNSDKYYGLYIAEVVSNKDPRKSSKVSIKIQGFNHDTDSVDNYPWARVSSTPFGGSRHKKVKQSSLPYEGSFVYVMFLQGDPDSPIVIGTVVGDDDSSSEVRGIQELSDINKTIDGNKVDKEDSPKIGQYPYVGGIEGMNYSVILDDSDDTPQVKIMLNTGTYLFLSGNDIQSKSVGNTKHFTMGETYFYSKGKYEVVCNSDVNYNVSNNYDFTVGGNVDWSISGSTNFTFDGPLTIHANSDMVIYGNVRILGGGLTADKLIKSKDDVQTAWCSLNKHQHDYDGGKKTSVPTIGGAF